MEQTKNLGNRKALLAGAKKCLLEKGYNRTTARDIASAAGVSLAAIGYHFSSKEALLTEALLLAFGEWDQDLQRALQAAVPPDSAPAQRFETTWQRIIATFESHRSLWVANFEIFAQMVGQPATREIVASKLHIARAGLASMFLNREEGTIDEHTVRTLGTFYHLLLSGLVLQWMMDPASALSARGLTESLRITAEALEGTRKSAQTGQKSQRKRRK